MGAHEQPRITELARPRVATKSANAALTRVAGAVALGLAENRMYWSASSCQCRDYLDALIATGWTPDEWTAATLTDRPDRD